MNNPDVIIKLERINDAKSVAALFDGQFPYTRAKARHRLGNFGRVAFRNLRQPASGLLLRRKRERAKIFQRALYPGNAAQGISSRETL